MAKRRGRITDKERLDWLQGMTKHCFVEIYLGGTQFFDIRERRTIRQAIDAAIRKQRKERES